MGVGVTSVQEIIRTCEITHVPNTPPHLLGVCNLRGCIVPVVDMRTRLGIPQAEPTRNSRIIVAQTSMGTVGVLVDQVTEVFHIDPDDTQAPVDAVSGQGKDYIRCLGKRNGQIVSLLDIDRVLCGPGKAQ
jgi:purine-binding chemotaxis protein CheW